VARGVRGLDRGAEGCSEHAVLDADAVGLFGIQAQAGSWTLYCRRAIVRCGADVEAHVGDGSFCPVAVGSLAPALGIREPSMAAGQTEAAVICADDRIEHYHVPG